MALEIYGGAELSIDRALRVLPETMRDTYRTAYEWIMEDAGTIGPQPYGKSKPKDLDVPLFAQRGIHKPSGLPYALTVTSSGTDTYAQDSLNELDDGTWVLQYCAHRRNSGERAGSPEYNKSLERCLKKGLPVGVFIKHGSTYRHMGLAFVEQYDTATDLFWLHGPVTAETGDALSPIPTHVRTKLVRANEIERTPDFELEPLFSQVAHALPPESDERDRVVAEIVRRKQQASFRKQLLDAYGGQCAISRCDVEPALQAAHITSYLGTKSQLASNGILLRADLHILFDRMLLGVDPDGMRVRISPQLSNSAYASLSGKKLTLPRLLPLQPSEQRVAARYANFLSANKLRGE